jgi:DNA-binding protein WhiA
MKLPLDNECCYLSELSALLRTIAEVKLVDGSFFVVIKTEHIALYERINTILERLYGFSVELEIAEDESAFHGFYYEIKIDKQYATKVLEDCGILSYNEEHHLEFNGGIDAYLIMDTCCKKSYIRGAFIGCGTSSIVLTKEDESPKKSSAGYHLEFVFHNEQLASDFAMLLAEFELFTKKVERKHHFIVYLKEGETISDLLALMGANKSVLKLNQEIVLRSLRNTVNRQNNCETGNIGKVVNASVKQLNAIKVVQQIIGLDQLTPSLQQAAMLRIANPEESLDALVQLSNEPITKSGLNHRFRKIIEIANELQKQ